MKLILFISLLIFPINKEINYIAIDLNRTWTGNQTPATCFQLWPGYKKKEAECFLLQIRTCILQCQASFPLLLQENKFDLEWLWKLRQDRVHPKFLTPNWGKNSGGSSNQAPKKPFLLVSVGMHGHRSFRSGIIRKFQRHWSYLSWKNQSKTLALMSYPPY